MMEHRKLLADYAVNASEQAFRQIIRDYIDLVYSTALRLVNGDTHRAQDVAQTVFADLARLAGSLPRNVMLGGWLHRRTFHVATTLMRHERRRERWEREACEMNDCHNNSSVEFEQIAPWLDEAINTLNRRERTVIVLRFFERRDLRSIGAVLGSSEDAAQKTVSRAVEKLRLILLRRGVAVPAGLMATALATHAVQTAPADLAVTVATLSLAGAAKTGATGFLSILNKIILMKKTTTIIVLTVAAVLTTGIVVLTYWLAANRPVTAKTLHSGLVLHLTLDQEATDGTIPDLSGRDNHGRASGVRWTPAGKRGGAYEFTADGQEIVVSNNATLNPEQFTLSAWIKTTTGDHYWRRIFDKSYSRGYALSVAGDWRENQWYGRVTMEIGPEEHFVVTQNRVDDGEWHHVAATFDGSQELIYVDGRLQGTFPWPEPGRAGATDFDLVIGCNRSNLDSKEDDLGVSFRGSIDEPMMWNRALSEKEVAFLYASQN